MADVKITYTLVDDVTAKAKKIQGSLETMEKTLKNIDDLNKKIGDSKDMANYAEQIKKVTTQTGGLNRSLIAVNSKLETQKKKANNSATAVNKLAEKQERLITALEDVNPLISDNSTEMGKAATNAKAYHTALGQVSAKSSNLNRSIGALTPKIETQADAFLRAHLASHAFEQSLDRVVDKEKELRDVMVAKNKEAKLQDRHFQNLDRNSAKAARSLDDTAEAMSKYRRKWDEIQSKDGALLDGMGMGATQYDLLKKFAAILPVIGVGLGGLGAMAASAGGTMGMLAGSAIRLSGALALLPGAYMAVGVAAGSFSAMNKTIFQPAIKGAEELTKLQEDLTKARAAEKPDAKKIAEIQKDIAAAQKSMPKSAARFNKQLAQTKSLWTQLWRGPDDERADFIIEKAAKGLLAMQVFMQKLNPLFYYAEMAFASMVDSATRISQNNKFVSNVIAIGRVSFDNFDKLLKVTENLAPLVSEIALNMAEVTNSALGSAVAWSEGYTTQQKIDEVSARTKKYFSDGLDSLKLWGSALGNFAKGFNTLFNGPGAKRFERMLGGTGKRFNSWSQGITGTTGSGAPRSLGGTPLPGAIVAADAKQTASQKYADFNENSLKVLGALGGVIGSIGSVLYKIGSNKQAADATVDFLEQLSGGIESFGGFALDAMTRLGPEMTKFFEAFGKAHKGSGEVLVTIITTIVKAITEVTKTVDKYTPNKLLAVVAGATAAATVVGSFIGTLAIAARIPKTGLAALKAVFDSVSRASKTKTPNTRTQTPVTTTSTTIQRVTIVSPNPLPVIIVGGTPNTKTPPGPAPVPIGPGGSKTRGRGRLRGNPPSTKTKPPKRPNPKGPRTIGIPKKPGGGGGATAAMLATYYGLTSGINGENFAGIASSIGGAVVGGKLGGRFGFAGSMVGSMVGSETALGLQEKYDKKGNITKGLAGLYGGKKALGAARSPLGRLGIRGAGQFLGSSAALPTALVGASVGSARGYERERSSGIKMSGIPSPQAALNVGIERHTFKDTHALEGYRRDMLMQASRTTKSHAGSALAGAPDSYSQELIQNGLKAANNPVGKGIGALAGLVKKAYDGAAKNTKTGGDRLKTQTDGVGKKVTKSLGGWARAVNQILGTMGVASSVVKSAQPSTKTASATGGQAGTSSQSAGGRAASGDSYYGSGRKGDSAQGSGSKTAGMSFNGHPGNVDAGLIPFIQKAQGSGLSVTSTTDHSKYTTSGNISNHFLGKAVDVSNGSSPTPQMDAFYNMLVPFARSGALSELIYKHNGWQRGSQYNYAGSDHFNHVHFALGSGGGGAGPLGALMGAVPTIPGVPDLGNTAFGQAVQARAGAVRKVLQAKLAAAAGGAMPGAESSSGLPTGDIPSMIAWAAAQYGAKPDGLTRIAQKESGFNTTVANTTDSNARAGTPSKGLFQFIASTFASMAPQAMAANPGAWQGVPMNWMDPKAQALTAAWAFTHGQGSHWSTMKWYGEGGDFMATKPQVIGVGDKQERVTITPKHKMRKGRGGSGSPTVNINISGLVVADDAGATKLADIVGPKVVAAIISASANASDGEDL